MRKAKRGLKRSEARRVGQRTYVHKDCSDDRLTSGASFPREIRVRTTLFATESESRAISSAACSPTRVAGEGSARAGSEEREGGEEEGTGSGWLTAPLSLSIASIPTESWGSKILQAMSDAARAPADSGVAANHARVLREWKQRLVRIFHHFERGTHIFYLSLCRCFSWKPGVIRSGDTILYGLCVFLSLRSSPLSSLFNRHVEVLLF